MTARNAILTLIAVVVLVEVFVRRDYARVIEIHVDVLAGMAQKSEAIAATGRRPTPNDLTELIYPLERARDFMDKYRDEADRASYVAFGELADLYESFTRAIDSARSLPQRWDEFAPQVPTEVARIRAAAARVRSALAEES